MSVSAVTSPMIAPAYTTQQAEQREAKGPGGRDVKNDHDSDDRVAAPAAGPTTNASGQTVGTTINRRA
jgi:hypothetical protein